MDTADRSPTRRAVLLTGALTIGAGTTGCTLNNPFDSTPEPVEKAVPDLSPDVAVAVQAVAAIRTAQQLVEATLATMPTSPTALRSLPALHRAHLDALVEAVPDGVDTSPSATSSPTPTPPAAAVRTIRVAERALHDQLIGFALRAESGVLARLLGSMAAAISQRLAVPA